MDVKQQKLCVCVCTHTHIHACVYACTSVYAYVSVCVHMCRSVYVCAGVQNCRICSDCGARTPGNGPSSRWHLNYSVCDSCYQQRNKGLCCPLCGKAYRHFQNKNMMVPCSSCKKWVMRFCCMSQAVEFLFLFFRRGGGGGWGGRGCHRLGWGWCRFGCKGEGVVVGLV